MHLEDDHEIAARAVLLATGAQYRRLPVDGLADYEGHERVLRGRPSRGAALRRPARRRGRRRQLGGPGRRLARPRRRARDAAAPPRAICARRCPTTSSLELERYGVAVRDRSEVAELHGANGQLEAVTLRDGDRMPFSFLFLFLGALPCTEWLGDVVARDEKGFILTGADADADDLLETSVPGIFAAGDVRSGSTKRCATAVGEGAMAVQFVHGRLAELSRGPRTTA